MEIEIDDNNIDVKDIMRQIKEGLNKRTYDNDLLEGITSHKATINLSVLEDHQLLLNRTWNYSAVTPITSHRRGIGGLIVFFKKCIRKVLGWYINPIVEKQTEFNANVVRAYNELINQLKLIEDISLDKINKSDTSAPAKHGDK